MRTNKNFFPDSLGSKNSFIERLPKDPGLGFKARRKSLGVVLRRVFIPNEEIQLVWKPQFGSFGELSPEAVGRVNKGNGLI